MTLQLLKGWGSVGFEPRNMLPVFDIDAMDQIGQDPQPARH